MACASPTENSGPVELIKYIVRRFGHALLVLFALTILVFLLVYLSGDPARALSPIDVSPQDLENLRRKLGVDQPLYVQYLRFLQDALHGDFGNSFRYRTSAMMMVLQRLPSTLALSFSSTVLLLVVSIPLGIYSGWRRNAFLTQIIDALCLLSISTPGFWLGIMLILVFAENLRLLPSSGRDSWQNLILPTITLSAYGIGLTTQLIRATFSDEIERAYVVTARAKGLKEWALGYRHVLKNTLIPVITVLGLQIGQFIGGTIIVETIFSWPGVGWLMMQAINTRDLPMIRAVVLVMGVFFTVINLGVDLLYCYLDPRIRYE